MGTAGGRVCRRGAGSRGRGHPPLTSAGSGLPRAAGAAGRERARHGRGGGAEGGRRRGGGAGPARALRRLQAVADAAVEVQSEVGGAYTIEGSLEMPFAADRVFAVLLDYEGSAEVYRNIVGTELTVEGGAKVLTQDCRWKFLVFSGSFQTSFDVLEDIPGMELLFRQREAGFLRDFTGLWKVTPLDGARCVVTHKMTVRPALSPPAFAGRIFAKQVEDILQDLQEGVARKAQ